MALSGWMNLDQEPIICICIYVNTKALIRIRLERKAHTHIHVQLPAARSCRWMQLPPYVSLSCHAAWVLCPLPCFSGMQTLFEWIATWTCLTWKHKQKPAGWNQMTGNWRSYAASISTWWLLYLTIALRGREIDPELEIGGRSHGSMIYCLCQSAKHLCEVRWTLPIGVKFRK